MVVVPFSSVICILGGCLFFVGFLFCGGWGGGGGGRVRLYYRLNNGE